MLLNRQSPTPSPVSQGSIAYEPNSQQPQPAGHHLQSVLFCRPVLIKLFLTKKKMPSQPRPALRLRLPPKFFLELLPLLTLPATPGVALRFTSPIACSRRRAPRPVPPELPRERLSMPPKLPSETPPQLPTHPPHINKEQPPCCRIIRTALPPALTYFPA